MAKGKCGQRDTCKEMSWDHKVMHLQVKDGRHHQKLEEAGRSLQGEWPCRCLDSGVALGGGSSGS